MQRGTVGGLALAVALGTGIAIGVTGGDRIARAWQGDGTTRQAAALPITPVAAFQPAAAEQTIIRAVQTVSPAVVLVERGGASGLRRRHPP